MSRNSLMPIAIVIGAMVILNVLDGSFSNFPQWIYQELLLLPGIIIGLSFHEFAHGIVSYRLGDPTPKQQGRLTLNPMAHIDPIGFLVIKDGVIRMINVTPPASNTVDRLIDMVPQVIDRVDSFIEKQKNAT